MSSGLKYGFARGYWNTAGLDHGHPVPVRGRGRRPGAVLATSEMAFNVVKYLGVAYLIYLGVRQIRTDAARRSRSTPAIPDRRRSASWSCAAS